MKGVGRNWKMWKAQSWWGVSGHTEVSLLDTMTLGHDVPWRRRYEEFDFLWSFMIFYDL